MSQEVEIWKPIVGYEGIYEVSNLSRVRSLDRICASGQPKTGVVLKPFFDGNYLAYKLNKGHRISKNFKQHRLVAIAFLPNPENKPQINHKNSIKTDNRLENLEWCNNSENQIHSFASGRKALAGQLHHQAKLTEGQVLAIRNERLSGSTMKALAEKYPVTTSQIFDIIHRNSWKHLPSQTPA